MTSCISPLCMLSSFVQLMLLIWCDCSSVNIAYIELMSFHCKCSIISRRPCCQHQWSCMLSTNKIQLGCCFYLNNKVFPPVSSQSLLTFELFSVMVHSGSAAGGHYYACIKSFSDGQWYSFNDQHVSKVSLSPSLTRCPLTALKCRAEWVTRLYQR